MKSHPLLFDVLYNKPHAITPGKLEEISQVYQRTLLGQNGDISAYYDDDGKPRKSYHVTDAGVAVVPVLGTLMHRSRGLAAMSGIAGYQALAQKIESAARDTDVKAIMLDVDSVGGTVAGLFQFTDQLASEKAAGKPIWSHSNESMFSGAYAIGATADRVIAARSSGVGSIGVIAMVADQTGFDKNIGVKYHVVKAGDKKDDFNPHAPIKQDALARLQAEVDDIYLQFVSHVANQMGISEDVVLGTEAGTYNARDALDIGLIHSIQNYDDALAELGEYANSKTGAIILPTRANTANKTGETMTEENVIAQADLDAARDEGLAEGRKSERERVAQILNSDAAKGRIDMAKTVALETDLSAEQAIAVLEKSPVAATLESTNKGSQFDAVMSQLNVDVGADTEETELTDFEYGARIGRGEF